MIREWDCRPKFRTHTDLSQACVDRPDRDLDLFGRAASFIPNQGEQATQRLEVSWK
jgi:hypothetical protein